MRWVGHPLVHFLVGGVAIFGAYAWNGPGARPPEDDGVEPVHIGPGEVAWLQEAWTRQWQRPATREEMIGLVTTHLKEELLAREARAMGLERDDTLVRRRLAQKLSFLLEDTFRLAEPSGAELRDYFAANVARYERGARVSFRHVYFDPGRRPDADSDARATLAGLVGAPDDEWESLGDRLLVESALAHADRQAIAALFGDGFADAVLNLEPGAWRGPVRSAYGVHLVRVDERFDPQAVVFEDVTSRVKEDWYVERHRIEVERYFAALMSKYRLDVAPEVRGMIGPLDELLPQAFGGASEPE